jgi:hypothetical protein
LRNFVAHSQQEPDGKNPAKDCAIMKSCLSTLLWLVFLTGILSLPGQAQATLGEAADSIARDSQALKAVKRATTTRYNYTVQEVVSDATEIREYLTLSGRVFAVAWNGLVHPDLTVLLGSYAKEFQDAKRQSPRKHGQRRLKVEAPRVVVETWGHMRNLRGRAYLPDLVPEGVNINDLK